MSPFFLVSLFLRLSGRQRNISTVYSDGGGGAGGPRSGPGSNIHLFNKNYTIYIQVALRGALSGVLAVI